MVYMLELTDCDGVGHGRNSLWELPLLAAKHWVLNNGRAANIIFTIPMVSLLPKWLNAALCGFLFFAMLMLACRFTGALDHGKPTVSLAVMTVFALAFPWWNEGFQFCVAMNYVATSAFILGLIALRRFPSFVCRHRCLCALFAFVTGMMHESASISAIAGAVGCLCLAYRTVSLKNIYGNLSPTDRLLSASFAVGAAIAVFSPGIWMRFFKVRQVLGNSTTAPYPPSCSRRCRCYLCCSLSCFSSLCPVGVGRACAAFLPTGRLHFVAWLR